MIPKASFYFSIVVVILAILGILGLSFLNGTSTQVTIGSLVGFLGLLITALINSSLIADVRKKVDGHLSEHMHLLPGHSEEELQTIIRRALKEYEKRDKADDRNRRARGRVRGQTEAH